MALAFGSFRGHFFDIPPVFFLEESLAKRFVLRTTPELHTDRKQQDGCRLFEKWVGSNGVGVGREVGWVG